MNNQYSGFFKAIARYFQAYGGWKAIFGSPLFHCALVVALLDYRTWLGAEWVDLSKSLIPSLLGFSLGTYAILFSLMTGRLKQTLQKVEVTPGTSYLAMVNATFFHFIFVQIAALAWAFVYGGTALTDIVGWLAAYWPFSRTAFGLLAAGGSLVGYLLLVYSFFLILGSALAVYRLAGIKEPLPPGS